MNNRIEVVGKVCYVGPVETVGSNGFKKRTFTIKEDGERYPTLLAFTLKKDFCDRIADGDVGGIVKVNAAVESRDWTDPKTNKVKFFTDVVALKIERMSSVEVAPEPIPEPAPSADSDNLPF